MARFDISKFMVPVLSLTAVLDGVVAVTQMPWTYKEMMI